MINKKVKNHLLGVITLAVLLLINYPILYMIFLSFTPPLQLFSHSIWISPTLQNYISLFDKLHISKYIVNSLYLALGSAGLSIMLGTLCAYSLTRFKYKGRKIFLFLILFVRMFPPIGTILPLFLMIRHWNLTDTYTSLILIYAAFQVSFVIWMMRGFFMAIPIEIEESAQIDGCSKLGAFFKVTLPLAAPGIVATSIFAFTLSWNEFLFALIFTADRTKPMPVVVPELIAETGVLWGEIAGAGTLGIIPILIFSFAVQKYLIRGLTFGAVKG